MSLPGIAFFGLLLTLLNTTIQEDKSKVCKVNQNNTILKDALEELVVMKIAEMNFDDWWKAARGFQDTIGVGFIQNLDKGLSFVIYLNVGDFDNIAQRIISLNSPEVALIACWRWSPRIVMWRVFIFLVLGSILFPNFLQNCLKTIRNGSKQAKMKLKKAMKYIQNTLENIFKALSPDASNSEDTGCSSPTRGEAALRLSSLLPPTPLQCQHCSGRGSQEEPVLKCKGCR